MRVKEKPRALYLPQRAASGTMLTTPASRQDGVEVGDRVRTVCASRVRTGTARAPGCGPRGAISVVTIFLGLQEGRKLAGDPRLGSASRFALQASTWSTWAKDSAVGRTYLSRVRNPGAKRELTRSASHASRVSFQSGCHHGRTETAFIRSLELLYLLLVVAVRGAPQLRLPLRPKWVVRWKCPRAAAAAELLAE